MRIAVTGGAGYIGSVVSEVLIDEGHDVLVIDDLSKGHVDAVPAGAGMAQLDIASRTDVTAALLAFRTEAVIHMAAASLVGESVTQPAKYYAANVVSGLALLDAMAQAGVHKLVFSSTAAVYGEPDRQPIRETDPLQPTNPYGDTKLAFERALGWYAHAYGLASISLRYFNAAGATDRHGERHDPETHLIPLVLQTAAGRRSQVTVFGDDYPTPDGTCVRDYVHVEDIARAHVSALQALRPGSAEACNLGCGGRGFSVRQVIDAVTVVTGRTIPVSIAGRRAGDPAVLIASAEQARNRLGWEPRHQSLEAIVASAWAWMVRRGVSEVDASDTRNPIEPEIHHVPPR
jgi:UDP-glucose 4-epimerase